jgi:hypothetical protein
MQFPENNDLEKFIHAQLQKLPDRQAPPSLVGNVLAAIAARKKLPWWKQSFTFWPRKVQCLLFVSLAALWIGAIYAAGRAANSVSVPDVSEQLSSYAWVGRALQTLGETFVATLMSLPTGYWMALGAIFLVLYGACLVTGFALFKVTRSAASGFETA